MVDEVDQSNWSEGGLASLGEMYLGILCSPFTVYPLHLVSQVNQRVLFFHLLYFWGLESACDLASGVQPLRCGQLRSGLGQGLGHPAPADSTQCSFRSCRWLTAGYGGQCLCPNTNAEKKHRQSSENFRRFPSVPIWNRFWHFHGKRSCSLLLLHTIKMNELCVSTVIWCVTTSLC